MKEIGWVVGLLLVFGALATIDLVHWSRLIAFGNQLMLSAAAVGIPAEALYFTSLGLCLRRTGHAPAGWYWRSFEHHHMLSPTQKLLVIPMFAVGTLAFLLISLGIVIVGLGIVGALTG